MIVHKHFFKCKDFFLTIGLKMCILSYVKSFHLTGRDNDAGENNENELLI
jgi:hypothetical protein